ncbi:MAG: hypothetical protein HY395_02275 [Candidatus Doudnabacteria bacterium]|nr:hypothetical protein [Candidatus Doudnabacteria bacterium]
MTLFIDTTDNDLVTIGLINKKIAKKTWQTKWLSETLLPTIERFLKLQRVKFQGLKKIVVVVGPGFFSRIRTGVATANALGYALNIPIAGVRQGFRRLKFGKAALPYYAKFPNITRSKPR